MTPLCTLRRALADPMLLGSALSGDSWQAWRTLLIAAMGEELSDEERRIFKRLPGREREPLLSTQAFLSPSRSSMQCLSAPRQQKM